MLIYTAMPKLHYPSHQEQYSADFSDLLMEARDGSVMSGVEDVGVEALRSKRTYHMELQLIKCQSLQDSDRAVLVLVAKRADEREVEG